MPQKAADETQAQASYSQPYCMWSPAQQTELNQQPFPCNVICIGARSLHGNTTQKQPSQMLDSNPRSSCCEATVPSTTPVVC